MGERTEKFCLSALLSAIMILMLLEAGRRHLFPASEPWTVRAAAGCLAWLVSLGMARAAALGLHIRVSCIDTFVSPTTRHRFSQFADIVFLFFCLASCMVGLVVLYRSFYRPDLTSSPVVYAAIPAGSILTSWRLVHRLLMNDGGET